MLIGGKSDIRQTGTFHLPRGKDQAFAIPIRALGPKFGLQMGERLPAITPPMDFARDPKGRVLRDKDDKPVERENPNDPAYRQKVNRRFFLMLAATIYHGTQQAADESGQPAVKFDADPGQIDSNPEQFYAAILGELQAVGVGEGEMLAWSNAIMALGQISKEDVATAEAGFPDGEGEEGS